MAPVDQSPYTLEQRLVTAVWVHERPHTGDTMVTVKLKFRDRFNVEPPRKATMLGWEKRAFQSGSVKDSPRSGRPIKRRETCHAVEVSVAQSPTKSTRKRSAELGIPRTTMMTHMKSDLKLKPYHPMHINELSDADMEARRVACGRLLRAFRSQCARDAVLFTDECAIYRSMHSRNVVFWAKENPMFYEELERNPPHVMVWCGLSATHIFGPFFFEAPVNGQNYEAMLSEWLVPQFQQEGIMDTVVLQQDGAPAHFSLHVRAYLDNILPGRWIGRGSADKPAPYAWPPRSPDLTTPDNALWGFIKERVSLLRYRTTRELKDAVRQAFQQVTADYLRKTSSRTWRRIQLCYDNGGQHTDILDP